MVKKNFRKDEKVSNKKKHFLKRGENKERFEKKKYGGEDKPRRFNKKDKEEKRSFRDNKKERFERTERNGEYKPKRFVKRDGEFKRSFRENKQERFKRTEQNGEERSKRFVKREESKKRNYREEKRERYYKRTEREGEDRPKRFIKREDNQKRFSRDDKRERYQKRTGEDRPKRFVKREDNQKRFSRDDKRERYQKRTGEERPKRFVKREDNQKRSFRDDKRERYQKRTGEDRPKRFVKREDNQKRSFRDDKRERYQKRTGEDRPKRFVKREDNQKRSFRNDKREYVKTSERQQSEKSVSKTWNKFQKPKSVIVKKHNKKKSLPFIAEDKSLNEPIRLNRFIAKGGVCSRREADELISKGLISVNGKVVTELGVKVHPKQDIVMYKGKRLVAEQLVYFLLNKPGNMITTMDDPLGRKTVMDLMSKATDVRIFPVGRLDRNTSGLLLFTNDGALTKKLTHPSHEVKKIYYVRLSKAVSQEDMLTLLKGVELEDGLAKVDRIDYAAGGEANEVGVELHSGKNRIVRRIFEHLHYKVEVLDRVGFAFLTKKNLPRGRWRTLTEKEVHFLKMI